MHINQSRSLLVKEFPSFSECIIHMGVNLGLYVDTIYNDISRVSLRWFAKSIFPKKGIFTMLIYWDKILSMPCKCIST